MNLKEKSAAFLNLIESQASFATDEDFFDEEGQRSCRLNLAYESVFAIGLADAETYMLLKKFKNENIIADFAFISDLEDEDEFAWGRAPSDIKFEAIGILLKENSPLLKTNLTGNEPISFYQEGNSGGILMGNRKCELPFKSLEYYTAEGIINRPRGEAVTEDDLFARFDRSVKKEDKPKRIRDAVIRINAKVRETFGIPKLIFYKNANYWINRPQ